MLSWSSLLRVSHRSGLRKFFSYPLNEINPVVFFDITVEGDALGQVTIELFHDAVPQTTENFRSLCTGERGGNQCPLYYKGVPFHRIIPGFIVQGGDILKKDGRGNASVFGFPFPDESFSGKAGKHLPGTVAMAHSGPNQNGSQFFFNLRRNEHLDGRFVVCGQVVEGWNVVEQVAMLCGSRCGVPVSRAWITDCGQSSGAKFEETEKALSGERSLHSMPGKEVLDLISPRTTRVESKMKEVHNNGGNCGPFPSNTRKFSSCIEPKEIGNCITKFIAATVLDERRGERDLLITESFALEMHQLGLTYCATPSSPGPWKAVCEVDVGTSSAGDSESVADRTNHSYEEKDEVLHVIPNIFSKDDILLQILSFLPWHCVLRARGVNKQFLRLSLPFVTLCRLPRYGTPALFIPCHENLLACERYLEDKLAPKSGLFACSKNANWSDPLSTYSKVSGQPQVSDVERVFLGQLRRDGTVPMVKWFLLTVMQMSPESLISVENHRHKTTKRGKGCAWVVLEKDVVPQVFSYHHRIFFDNVRDVEGVWLVSPAFKDGLSAFATDRGSLPQRQKHLPRSRLVVESPKLDVSPATMSITRSSMSTPQMSPFPSQSPHRSPSISALVPKSKNDQQTGVSWRYNPYSLTSRIELNLK